MLFLTDGEPPFQFLIVNAVVGVGSDINRKMLPYSFHFCIEIWSSLLAEDTASVEAGLAKVKHLLNATHECHASFSKIRCPSCWPHSLSTLGGKDNKMQRSCSGIILIQTAGPF